ncbi:MAG: hypothetical protein DRQ57_07620 [Gammaproteobacteria bacterium]|nr:MAG: hypothetical protein DRQ57_07620 [Gammaproteobacteria bacterium]
MKITCKVKESQPKLTSPRAKKTQHARYGLSANTSTRAGYYSWFKGDGLGGGDYDDTLKK